jgi:hypothetical protein
LCTRGQILEEDRAVIGWMDILLHWVWMTPVTLTTVQVW